MRIVIYGVGSPVIVDFEESLFRCGHEVAAAVRNHPAESFFAGDARLIDVDAIERELLALPYAVPLFTPGHRQAAARDAEGNGFTMPFSLVDATSVVPRSLDFGRGCYINAGCSIGARSSMGDFVFVNRGCGIGHHARIDRFVSIGPGAILAGHVVIERGAVIGTGATILPEITIGANAIVAAGSVVTKDVAPSTVVAGNPAIVKKTSILGYHDIAVL